MDLFCHLHSELCIWKLLCWKNMLYPHQSLKKMMDGTPKTGKSTVCHNIWVHNKSKKLSVCMENNLEIVCGVCLMMNDTPSTGKSTLCCNVSITQQTKKKIFICMENNFEIVRCVPLRMTLPVPENQHYAIIFWWPNQPKYPFAWKTVYMRVGRALARGVHGGPGGSPVVGVARGQRPLS